MKPYTVKLDTAAARPVVLDDMILTKDMPTAAGSRMLAGYMSLFDAEAVTRLTAAGYTVTGKAAVGEFGFDLLGETAADGALVCEGALRYPTAEIVAADAVPAVCLDVNGAPRRAAAQAGLVYVKPTYGTVSRYGTVPVACSGETVGVMARTAAECRAVLSAIALAVTFLILAVRKRSITGALLALATATGGAVGATLLLDAAVAPDPDGESVVLPGEDAEEDQAELFDESEALEAARSIENLL